MKNTIAQQWAEFEAQVLPPGCSDIQRQEMRRAFYGGAIGMMSLYHTLEGDEYSEEACMAMIEGWHHEVALFVQRMNAGHA